MMALFGGKSISTPFKEKRRFAFQKVDRTERTQLLKLDSTAYADQIAAEFKVEGLVIDFGKATQSAEFRRPHQLEWSRTLLHRQGDSERPVVTFHIPLAGDHNLLCIQPSRGRVLELDSHIQIVPTLLSFTVVSWGAGEDGKEVMAAFNSIRLSVEKLNRLLSEDIEGFNTQFPAVIREYIEKKKETYRSQVKFMESLPIPMKKATLPPVLEVPIKPKQIVVKAVESAALTETEWHLQEATYRNVVDVIFAFGRGMERHPSTYFGKQEEDLRDLFLMLLTPYFDSATGESFNKKGKTDILIRHAGHNVFVAECKNWSGQVNYMKAIDQLLHNLTWRDSTAALLVFVRGKKIEPVISAVEIKTKEHRCWIADRGCEGVGRYRFTFHLNGDKSRLVHLTVVCFHCPSVEPWT